MAEYIEREKAYELARTSDYYSDFHKSIADLTSLKELLDDTPTADVVEVKHGEWEKDVNFSKIVNKYKCSLCGAEDIVLHHNYCPSCGAKMDKKEGAEE